MANWKDDLLLKAVNVLAIIFTGGSSLSTVVAPKHYYFGGSKQTYIHPAHFTFHVWGLIHLLLIGYVIVQFMDAGYSPVKAVGWRFPVLAVLNGIFVTLFSKNQYIAAFVFSILVAMLVSHIYYSLKRDIKPDNKLALAFVHLPFSLWHGFSVVLFVVSFFAAVGVDKSHQSAGVVTRVFAVIAIAFLTSLSWAYSFGDDGRGDIAGALVIAWSLLGIFIEQKHPALIHWIALAGFVLSVLALVKALFTSGKRLGGIRLRSDEERAPLVAGTE